MRKEGGVSLENRENEDFHSRIILHFFRHSEKEKDVNKTNEELLLTEKGRLDALEDGKKILEPKKTSVAYGGHVLRSQESAGFEMAGAHGRYDMTGKEDLEELKEKLNSDLKWGSRLGLDERLSFDYKTKEFTDKVGEAYKEGKGLSFMVYESEQFAEDIGDKESTTYSKIGARMSEVLIKYIKIANNFDRLINDPQKNKMYGNELERFMGSHMGAMDVFLCKIIEKVKGTEERDKLVDLLGGQGFEFGEGFEVEIITRNPGEDPELRVEYRKDGEDPFVFDEVISKEVLEEIIKEGK